MDSFFLSLSTLSFQLSAYSCAQRVAFLIAMFLEVNCLHEVMSSHKLVQRDNQFLDWSAN